MGARESTREERIESDSEYFCVYVSMKKSERNRKEERMREVDRRRGEEVLDCVTYMCVSINIGASLQ